MVVDAGQAAGMAGGVLGPAVHPGDLDDGSALAVVEWPRHRRAPRRRGD
jgi:hypothetical protein